MGTLRRAFFERPAGADYEAKAMEKEQFITIEGTALDLRRPATPPGAPLFRRLRLRLIWKTIQGLAPGRGGALPEKPHTSG